MNQTAAQKQTEVRSDDATSKLSVATVDMKLEVQVIPVSDVDRAREFYVKLGWRLDVTPPGSGCSVIFGRNVTSAAPGSALGFVVVSDIQAAREQLIAAGIQVGAIFHMGANGQESGPDPQHRSYFSRASFSDPDGNKWLLQEITTRLPGRIDSGVTSVGSASDLANAMRRAATAHGEHEKRIGQADPNWPDWYAKYMATEQTGCELPQ